MHLPQPLAVQLSYVQLAPACCSSLSTKRMYRPNVILFLDTVRVSFALLLSQRDLLCTLRKKTILRSRWTPSVHTEIQHSFLKVWNEEMLLRWSCLLGISKALSSALKKKRCIITAKILFFYFLPFYETCTWKGFVFNLFFTSCFILDWQKLLTLSDFSFFTLK